MFFVRLVIDRQDIGLERFGQLDMHACMEFAHGSRERPNPRVLEIDVTTAAARV